MREIDKSRLIAAVADRLKIRLDENDPAFVLVELNRLVLDQTVRDLLQQVRDNESRLASLPERDPQTAEKFAIRVAEHLAQNLHLQPTIKIAPGTESKGPIAGATRKMAAAAVSTWVAALAAALALALCALAIGYQLGMTHARLAG